MAFDFGMTGHGGEDEYLCIFTCTVSKLSEYEMRHCKRSMVRVICDEAPPRNCTCIKQFCENPLRARTEKTIVLLRVVLVQ